MTPQKMLLLLLSVTCIFACTETQDPIETQSQEPVVFEYGTISGTVTDAGTGNPIPGVTVTLLGQSLNTGLDGVYTFQNILYGDAYDLLVEDTDYKPHRQSFPFKQQRLTLNVALAPLNDPVLEIEGLFGRFADLLESVDPENIEAIQTFFSETYLAADDDATLFGVASGIIPANYEDVVPAITQLFEEYVFLEFRFKDMEMDITHARKAAVTLRLDVDARKGVEEGLREIKASCTFEFRREGRDWKVVYWQLLEIDIRL